MWDDFSQGDLMTVNIQREAGGSYGLLLNDRNGVIAILPSASEATRRSLQKGDVIVAVDSVPVRACEVELAINRDSHTLHVLRGWTTTL